MPRLRKGGSPSPATVENENAVTASGATPGDGEALTQLDFNKLVCMKSPDEPSRPPATWKVHLEQDSDIQEPSTDTTEKLVGRKRGRTVEGVVSG